MAYAAPRQFTDIDALVIRAAAACGIAALELSRLFGPDANGKPLLSRQTADKIIKRQSYRLPYRMLPRLRKVFVYRPVLITEHAYPGGGTFTRENDCEWNAANFFEFVKGEPGRAADSYIWNEALGHEVMHPRFWQWADRIDQVEAPYEVDSDTEYRTRAAVVAGLMTEYVETFRALRGLPPHTVKPTRRELRVWREYEQERKADELETKRMRKAALKWRYNPANPAEIERRRKIGETQRRKVYGDAYIPNYEETIKAPPLTAEQYDELVARGVNQGPNWTEPPPDVTGTRVGFRYRRVTRRK